MYFQNENCSIWVLYAILHCASSAKIHEQHFNKNFRNSTFLFFCVLKYLLYIVFNIHPSYSKELHTKHFIWKLARFILINYFILFLFYFIYYCHSIGGRSHFKFNAMSVSTPGVVERASKEISRRIHSLGFKTSRSSSPSRSSSASRSSSPSPSPKVWLFLN